MKTAWLGYKANKIIEDHMNKIGRETGERNEDDQEEWSETEEWQVNEEELREIYKRIGINEDEEETNETGEQENNTKPLEERIEEEHEKEEEEWNENKIEEEYYEPPAEIREKERWAESLVTRIILEENEAYDPIIKLDINNPLKEREISQGFKDFLMLGPRNFVRIKELLKTDPFITTKRFNMISNQIIEDYYDNEIKLKEYNFTEKDIEEISKNLIANSYPEFLPEPIKTRYYLKAGFDREPKKATQYLAGVLIANQLTEEIIYNYWEEIQAIPRELIMASQKITGLGIITLPVIIEYNPRIEVILNTSLEEQIINEFYKDPIITGFITYYKRKGIGVNEVINNLTKKEKRTVKEMSVEERTAYYYGIELGEESLKRIINEWRREKNES